MLGLVAGRWSAPRRTTPRGSFTTAATGRLPWRMGGCAIVGTVADVRGRDLHDVAAQNYRTQNTHIIHTHKHAHTLKHAHKHTRTQSNTHAHSNRHTQAHTLTKLTHAHTCRHTRTHKHAHAINRTHRAGVRVRRDVAARDRQCSHGVPGGTVETVKSRRRSDGTGPQRYHSNGTGPKR
jgi:hypothetical protein